MYSEVMSSICAEFGKEFTWEIKAQQMGMTQVKAANVLISESSIIFEVRGRWSSTLRSRRSFGLLAVASDTLPFA